MRIGQDLDGCVVDFTRTANQHLADFLGVLPVVPDRWDWAPQYAEERAVSKTQADKAWRAMWREVNEGQLFARCKPIAGAIPALRLLEEEGHEIVYITHRHPDTARATYGWLGEYGVLHDVHFVKDKGLVPCDLYVDDKPENVRDLRALGHEAVLFDAPWNLNATLPRVRGWGEVVELVVRMSRTVVA